ncbi:hypothetical protein [Streptomyces lateritius]|uniref:hypothetical protein n=1 Tax=Streptomyces lateritius TaxID=67313 RepID=UPI0016780B62|nr:hypothetical protein [Streptomyces lateritius]GGU11433.1 hypothetical protein GCM10010272_65830 [Streptomyces lateritius]
MPETSPEPTPTDGHDYVPTEVDLKELTDFVWERTREEAGTAGQMNYFRDSAGMTLAPHFLRPGLVSETARQDGERKGSKWWEEHSPERFVNMAHTVFNLTLTLADRARVAMARRDLGYEYGVRHCWDAMTQAADLWKDHPDFKPSWAEVEEPAETV